MIKKPFKRQGNRPYLSRASYLRPSSTLSNRLGLWLYSLSSPFGKFFFDSLCFFSSGLYHLYMMPLFLLLPYSPQNHRSTSYREYQPPSTQPYFLFTRREATSNYTFGRELRTYPYICAWGNGKQGSFTLDGEVILLIVLCILIH